MVLCADEVNKWSKEQVRDWLKVQGYGLVVHGRFFDQDVDGYVLLRLTENDLRREPMAMSSLGAIKKIIGAISEFEKIEKYLPSDKSSTNPLQSPISTGTSNTVTSVCSRCSHRMNGDGDVNDSSDDKPQLKPEKRKALAAWFYASLVMYFCSMALIIVNDSAPDMEKYPPLPDLFLDNVPFIPWGFVAAEYIGFCLSILLVVIVITHKHRFIIIRRFLSLAGTLFLLRALCILLTSLPVPCKFFKCQQILKEGDMFTRLLEAFYIFFSGGLSFNGMRFCGDYMFSGHTTFLTLTNLFIDRYTPSKYPIIKTVCWTGNVFGLFFILAAHEHYSIDVFIAFYLTTRLTLYYHTLADSVVRLKHSEHNVRVWFPLFSYFESECRGPVPNEYELPISFPRFKSKTSAKMS